MAKGKGKGKSLHQHLAGSRQRGPKGRFLPVPKGSAAAGVPSAATTTVMQQQVDFLRAIIQQREEMGFSTGTLDKIVLGIDSKISIRKQLLDYVAANASKFDVNDPAGKAARTLFRETVQLADESLSASNAEAAVIYEKLKFLREMAEKTQGAQSEIAKQLKEVIAPVEEQLKKQTSFRSFVKDKAMDFKKRIPERLAAKIPIVGGLVSEFLQQKREARESLEGYSGTLLTEKAQKGGSSRFLGGGLPMGGAAAALGGTPASEIPGLLGGMGGGGEVLGAIHAEVKKIREILVDRFGPSTDELKAREAELEGKKEAAKEKAKTAEKGKKGGVRGFLSDLMDGGFRKTKIGRAFRKARVFGKRAMRRLGGLGRGLKRSKLFRRGRVLTKMLGRSGFAKKAMGLGKRGLGMARSLGGKALGGVGKMASSAVSSVGSAASSAGSMVSTAAKAGGGMLSSLWSGAKGLVGKVGDGLSSIKGLAGGIGGLGKMVIGAVGPLLETVFAAKDIASIKSDPSMSPEEKKKEIGLRIGKAIGSIVGQVGLSAALGPAGSVIGAALEAMGIGGGMIGEWLTEQIGPEKIYDLATAIPVIGPMIALPEETEGQPKGAGAAGDLLDSAGGTVSGTISAPATPNTSVGAMVSAHNAEMGALSDAQAAAASPGGGVTNKSVVNSNVNNVVNNFNDDLRIRNNEPTVKQAQMMIHSSF